MIAVAGPTGSGKSELAIRIAEEFGGEVVNCDSVQLYRGFDIGTAKTPEAERRGIPHHLVDVLEPEEVFTAGDYSRVARETIRGMAARGRLPVLAGGTGFYLTALVDGLFAGPPRNAELRRRLAAREARRPGSLHRLLSRFDAQAALKIHPRDVNKTMRALEVCLIARRPITDMFSEGRDPLTGFDVLKIGLNPSRERLYERINQRTVQMFSCGLVDEARFLLNRGVPRSAKPFESVGYREALLEIDGEFTREKAIAMTQQATRQYAKRQWTWFRKDPRMRWLDGFGDDAPVQAEALALAAVHLSVSPNTSLHEINFQIPSEPN